MGQALAAKVNATGNKQDPLIKREMRDNHPFVAAQKVLNTVPHPTQVRMPNMPIVPFSGPQGVWSAVLIITKYK